MLADLREALRQLRKAPGFTATAVITLALGIGATTAIFTLVHQVMLKSLPVTKPGRALAHRRQRSAAATGAATPRASDGDFSLFSWEAYKNFREHTPEFADLAALQAGNAPLGVRRAGSQAPVDTRNGEYVSGNFFRTLGVHPWIGRLMTDADDQQGAPPVAVMSYRIWSDKYGSDPSVVGASYQINGHPFTVIGVAPPGFYGAKLGGWGMPDFWLPVTTELCIDGAAARLKRPNRNFLDLHRPRASRRRSQDRSKPNCEWSSMTGWPATCPIWSPARKQTLAAADPASRFPAAPALRPCAINIEDGLKLLLIAAGCVLLVACGNLANLMLARGLKERSHRRRPRRSGRVARAAGAQGAGRVHAARGHRRRTRHRSGLCGQQADSLSRVPQRRRPDNYVPVECVAILARAALHARGLGAHRNAFRYRSRLDDFACRSGRSAARQQSFRARRRLHGRRSRW